MMSFPLLQGSWPEVGPSRLDQGIQLCEEGDGYIGVSDKSS